MAEMDLGRAAEGFAQMAADLERQAARFEELQGRMSTLTATATGPGGRVSVTVDSNGVPVAIDISQSARGMDPRALSAEIMACMRSAQAKLRGDVAAVVQGTVGEHPAGAAIVDSFTQRFPDTEPTPPEPAPPVPQQPTYTPPPQAPPAPQPGPATEQSPTPRTRKPDRDQIVTPDEPDDDDDYFNKKSWLV
ncbi:YbaB/EbfC family nucleoid-associated protein [Nocardia sp. NPDC127579]|uniref:YbaB/EbfC family nucleoid-associated protein n=1 Tax=Nocardia sp. NPDC127579 TaxID=3345402 RepID=UPI003633C9DF